MPPTTRCSPRDPRFDGVFFVAVTTTGIYCRPICTARTPGRTRCEFYPTAALAEQAGFRACFRCRPELAPGNAEVDALDALVAAATHRITEGALNDESLDALAGDLGVTARHLRSARCRRGSGCRRSSSRRRGGSRSPSSCCTTPRSR